MLLCADQDSIANRLVTLPFERDVLEQGLE